MDKKDINLCFIEDPHSMHECSTRNCDRQPHCSFYEKSRFMNKCTHFQMDWLCQNKMAYPTAKTVRVKDEDLPAISGGEGLWGESSIEHLHKHTKERNERLREMIERDWMKYKGMPCEFVATPSGENHFHNLYKQEYLQGRQQEYTYGAFVSAVMNYVEREIGGNGWDDRLHLMKCGDLSTLGNRDAYRFEFETQYGDVIYVAWHVGDKPRTDHEAAKVGVRVARDAIQYYSARFIPKVKANPQWL